MGKIRVKKLSELESSIDELESLIKETEETIKMLEEKKVMEEVKAKDEDSKKDKEVVFAEEVAEEDIEDDDSRTLQIEWSSTRRKATIALSGIVKPKLVIETLWGSLGKLIKQLAKASDVSASKSLVLFLEAVEDGFNSK